MGIFCLWILSVAIFIAPLIDWKERNQNNSNYCTVTKQVCYVMFSVSRQWLYFNADYYVCVYKIYREATKHSKYLNRGALTAKIDESNGVVLRIHIGRNSQTNIQHYKSSRYEHNILTIYELKAHNAFIFFSLTDKPSYLITHACMKSCSFDQGYTCMI